VNIGKRYKISNESLILRFFRHLVTKTADRNVVYNISKGRIGYKSGDRVRQSNRGIHISIKDPFLKLENHGYWLKDDRNFHQIILKLKEFILAVQSSRIEDYILQI
jgi:hypothetical protein